MSRQMLRRKGGVTSRKVQVAPAEMSVGVLKLGCEQTFLALNSRRSFADMRKSDSSSVCLATTSKGFAQRTDPKPIAKSLFALSAYAARNDALKVRALRFGHCILCSSSVCSLSSLLPLASCLRPMQLLRTLDSGFEVRLVEIVGQHDTSPLKLPVDVNRKDRDGDRTPLHWAAARGSIHCLNLLLQFGADCGVLDASGMTPAALALSYGQMQCHEALMCGYRSSRLNEERPVAVQ